MYQNIFNNYSDDIYSESEPLIVASVKDNTDIDIESHQKKLNKLYSNSLFIQGYIREIKSKTRKYFLINFNHINQIICNFYAFKSLYNAVCIQEGEICEYILNNKLCDIDDQNSMQYKMNKLTPLIKAVHLGNIKLINLLLVYKNKNKMVQMPYMPFYIPSYQNQMYHNTQHSEYTVNPLSFCIDKLIENQNENQNEHDKYFEITTILLKNQMSPNEISTKYKSSLIHYACKNNDFDFIKTLFNKYHIYPMIAIEKDNDNYTAMNYISNNDEIKIYLNNQIKTYEKNKEIANRPMDSGFGILFYSLLSFCCFIPWSLLEIIIAILYLIESDNINVNIIWISILSIISALFLIIMVVIIFIYSPYNFSVCRAVSIIIAITLVQIYALLILVVPLVFNDYTQATLALSITNVFLCVIVDLCGLAAYFFGKK